MIGKRPIGYRSPIWQFSPNTVRILHDAGFRYTSDFMHTLLPTFNEVGGSAIDMVNLPGSWVLDDAVYFQFHISARDGDARQPTCWRSTRRSSSRSMRPAACSCW